jgi:hypothetical protein
LNQGKSKAFRWKNRWRVRARSPGCESLRSEARIPSNFIIPNAQDLKSWDCKKSCGFESHHRQQSVFPSPFIPFASVNRCRFIAVTKRHTFLPRR